MAITQKRLNQYRRVLEKLAGRVTNDLESLEDETRKGVGGEAGGNLSNTPMHLADLGSEQYMQELNATLMENEEYIAREVEAALGRLAAGTFGTCERCGKAIPEARLEVIPYTRFCTPCSAAVADGATVNMNDGRPGSMGGLERRQGAGSGDASGIADLDQPFTDALAHLPPVSKVDHASGTPGGGTAIGGLAGTNIGEGDPDDGDLEAAMGSSHFDEELPADDKDTTAYSGPSGGAVGGAVADLRATGGKIGRGIAPQTGEGDNSSRH